jgi:hypothetical protein
MRVRSSLAAATLTLTLASCGGASTHEQTTVRTEPDAEDVGPVPSPPETWASMDHDARAAWMMSEVVPRMQGHFEGYDGERYAQVGCVTCHGPNAREEGFAMPCRSLPALPATGTPEQRQMVRDYPEGTRFMFNHIMPTMQALLGAAAFDEASGEGFTCYACHPHAGDEGTQLIRLSQPDAADAGEGS